MLTVREVYEQAKELAGTQIVLNGWLRTVRDSKVIGFLELGDGTCQKSVQVVVDEKMADFSRTIALGVGTAVEVRGELVLTPEAKQLFEIKAEAVRVVGDCPPDYPLQKKRHSMEYLRTVAHLRPRTNTFQAVFRVRSEAAFAVHEFFHGRGFVYAHTPIITGSDCEGAGEMFRVTCLEPGKTDYSEDFFGKQTGLTVSGQLEAETFAQAFSRTYTFGPTFRAENSNTPRHAAEFWMIEPELAFADLNDDMELAEAMVKHVINRVMERCPDEIRFFADFVDKQLMERLEAVRNAKFARMSYTQAVAELEKAADSFKYPVFWGCDLQTEHERYLTEKVVGGPVFVTDYPKEIKAFYMRVNEDGKTVAAMDMLVPGVGELIGGSQREERHDVLVARIRELELEVEDYSWYLDLRKFGSTPHAGFGLGFERMIMYLTGMSNIRDVIAFPRTPGFAEF